MPLCGTVPLGYASQVQPIVVNMKSFSSECYLDVQNTVRDIPVPHFMLYELLAFLSHSSSEAMDYVVHVFMILPMAAGLSLAPLVVKVDPNLNVILTACLTVYVGCYRSVKPTPPSVSTIDYPS